MLMYEEIIGIISETDPEIVQETYLEKHICMRVKHTEIVTELKMNDIC